MTPQEKAKDKRLQKCYRWSLDMYNALGEIQNWCCAVCGRKAKDKNLNLDHKHFKIISYRTPVSQSLDFKKWVAETTVQGRYIARQADTKQGAIDLVKDEALPFSVRGLLCPGRHGHAGHGSCNRLLGRIDNIIWLAQCINYLKNPPAAKIIFSGEKT